MEIVSQIGLKAQKICIQTTVIGIISFKQQINGFLDNPGHCIWQPFMFSSQPIQDFLARKMSHDFSSLLQVTRYWRYVADAYKDMANEGSDMQNVGIL